MKLTDLIAEKNKRSAAWGTSQRRVNILLGIKRAAEKLKLDFRYENDLIEARNSQANDRNALDDYYDLLREWVTKDHAAGRFHIIVDDDTFKTSEMYRDYSLTVHIISDISGLVELLGFPLERLDLSRFKTDTFGRFVSRSFDEDGYYDY